jgi:hypothetical protein
MSGDLAELRSALDLYASEHNGSFPALPTATVTAQLTEYTDDAGNTSTSKSTVYVYGPYLRTVPTLPLGGTGYKGASSFVDGSSGTSGASAGGWFYNATTGAVTANLDPSLQDSRGIAYNMY